jgi:hypothetical protein
VPFSQQHKQRLVDPVDLRTSSLDSQSAGSFAAAVTGVPQVMRLLLVCTGKAAISTIPRQNLDRAGSQDHTGSMSEPSETA